MTVENTKVKSAQTQADEMQVRLIALATVPSSKHLELVLCECGGVHPYVTWIFNKELSGFHLGNYCATLADAVEAFDQRIARYGAQRVPLVP